MLCSCLTTRAVIVFRPHDESVKGKYAMERKERGNVFSGNIYIYIPDMTKICPYVSIYHWV